MKRREQLSWICPSCTNERNEGLQIVGNGDQGGFVEVLTNTKENKNLLKVAHINVNGLENKLSEIMVLLQEKDFDVLGLTETHLTDQITDEHLLIDGYKLYRRDRDGSECKDAPKGYGGCLTYVKTSLISVPMTDKYNNNNIEAVWVELTSNSQKILIGNLYRHPKDLAIYEKLQNTLEQILARRKNVAIVGDLNSDLLTRGKTEDEQALGKKLKNVLNNFKLHNVISDATRITENSRTLIDVFITSNKEKIKESGVIHYGKSDHSIIYAIHKMVLEKKRPVIKTVRSFRNFDHNQLNRDMGNAPWVVCQDDVDDQLWAWGQIFEDIMQSQIPKRQAKIRQKTLPWIDRDIRKLMNQRFKALRKFKNTNKIDDWLHYKHLRYAVTKSLRQAEAKYWDNCFKESTNAKDFWSVFKKITKKDHKSEIGALEVNGSIISQDLEKAEALNDFFANIGAELAKPFEGSCESDLDRHIYRITPSITSIPPCSSEFISQKLSKLNPAKATGDDDVSSRELKLVHESVAQGLSSIINQSLKSKMYPSAWKIAKLKAAYKKGISKDRGNYRPLSLLGVTSKVYEAKIGSHLDDHIKFYNLSSINQWGFKAGLSTEAMLLCLSEKWKEALDNNKVIGTVFIDFRKAFDTINHKVLLRKLHATGISGSVYELIESYLKDRRQYVEINGSKSKLKIVEVGVPQGSLLGPRLFAIYVNDLLAAAKIGDIHMYADDTTVFVIKDTVDEAVIALHLITDDLNNWCYHNKLTIHHDKTEAMIITTSKFNGPLMPVKIGNKIIKYVQKTKCLGIIIDQQLNWKQQVDAVHKSYCTKLKLLTRLNYLPKQTLEEIYFKTIIPSVVYCIAVWGSSVESGLQKLEKVHARAARIVNQLPKDHDTEVTLERAGWPPLSYIYKKRIITIMHGCFHGRYDHRIAEMLNVNQRKRIGKENNFQIIRPKKEIGRNSFRFRGPVIWNLVADDIKNIKNKNTFKEKLKSMKDTIIRTSFKKGTTFNSNKDANFLYF